MGRRKGQRHTCNWCSIQGHNEVACHVKAEGRRQADDADRLACELSGGGRVSRASIAHRIRELGSRLTFVLHPSSGPHSTYRHEPGSRHGTWTVTRVLGSTAYNTGVYEVECVACGFVCEKDSLALWRSRRGVGCPHCLQLKRAARRTAKAAKIEGYRAASALSQERTLVWTGSRHLRVSEAASSLGISRQAVEQYVQRHGEDMSERFAALEAAE